MADEPQLFPSLWDTSPLNFQGKLPEIPSKVLKALPEFDGTGKTAYEHCQDVAALASIFNITDETIMVTLLVTSFRGKVQLWYIYLPSRSISTWADLAGPFVEQFGEGGNWFSLLNHFILIKRHPQESIPDFNLRFMKTWNRVPYEVRPSKYHALIYFAGAFEPDISLQILQSGQTFPEVYEIAQEAENLLISVGKIAPLNVLPYFLELPNSSSSPLPIASTSPLAPIPQLPAPSSSNVIQNTASFTSESTKIQQLEELVSAMTNRITLMEEAFVRGLTNNVTLMDRDQAEKKCEPQYQSLSASSKAEPPLANVIQNTATFTSESTKIRQLEALVSGLTNKVTLVDTHQAKKKYEPQCQSFSSLSEAEDYVANDRAAPQTTSGKQGMHTLEFDGASKGNPGLSGAGIVLRNPDGSVARKIIEGVGVGTSNAAEYRALNRELEYAQSQGINRIQVKGDSQLVCKQVNGDWKTRSQNLADLSLKAKNLKEFHIEHIPRASNSEADSLANDAVNLPDGKWVPC